MDFQIIFLNLGAITFTFIIRSFANYRIGFILYLPKHKVETLIFRLIITYEINDLFVAAMGVAPNIIN